MNLDFPTIVPNQDLAIDAQKQSQGALADFDSFVANHPSNPQSPALNDFDQHVANLQAAQPQPAPAPMPGPALVPHGSYYADPNFSSDLQRYRDRVNQLQPGLGDFAAAQARLETGNGQNFSTPYNFGNINNTDSNPKGGGGFSGPEAAADAYVNFLTNNGGQTRYQALLDAAKRGADVGTLATLAKAAGYATDPNYAAKVAAIAGQPLPANVPMPTSPVAPSTPPSSDNGNGGGLGGLLGGIKNAVGSAASNLGSTAHSELDDFDSFVSKGLANLGSAANSAANTVGTALNTVANSNPDELIKDAGSALTDVALNQAPLTDEERAQVKTGLQNTAGNFASNMLAQGAQNVQDIESGNPDLMARGGSNIVGYGGLSGAGEDAAQAAARAAAAGKATEAESAAAQAPGQLGLNINPAHMPEDVMPAIQNTYDANAAAIDQARRGVISDQQAVQNAQNFARDTGQSVDDVVAKWQPGNAANEETMIALRNALVDQQRAAQAARDAWAADASTPNYQIMQAAQAKADNMQTVVQGLTAEAGRALRAMGIDVNDPLVLSKLADNPTFVKAIDTSYKPNALPAAIGGSASVPHGTAVRGDITQAIPQQQEMLPGLEPPAIGQNTVQAAVKPFTADVVTPEDVAAVRDLARTGLASPWEPWATYADRTPRGGLADIPAPVQGIEPMIPGLEPPALYGEKPFTADAGTPADIASISSPPGATWRDRGQAVLTGAGQAMDTVNAYRYASMLSDPMTHISNIVGNAVATLGGPIEDLAAGRPVAAVQRVVGTMAGIQDGLSDALRALAKGPAYGREGTGVRETFGGGLKNPLNVPGRLLGAADDFFSVINSRGELYAQAAQEASRLGFKVGTSAWTKKVAENVLNPSPKVYDAVQQARTYRTFQSAMTGWEHNLEQVARTPAGKFIMPFFRTPWNMTKYALERSPAGLVNVGKNVLAGNMAEAQTAAGRMMAGSALMFGLTGLAAQGLITGPKPTDPTQADEWRREGRQPNSIMIGGHWIDYRFAGPFTVHFAAAAAMANAMKQGDNPAATAALTAMSAGRAMLDLPFLRGAADIYDAITSQDTSGPQKVMYWLDSNVSREAAPLAGFWHFIARATDQTLRDPQNPVEAAYADLPGASQLVQPRLDAFGHPQQRPAEQMGLGALNPLRPETPTNDPVEAKIAQLQSQGYKVSPGFVGKNVTVNGKAVPLSGKQQFGYQQQAGQVAYDWIATQLVGNPKFEALPADQQAKAITQAVNDARQAVRDTSLGPTQLGVATPAPSFGPAGPKYYGVNDPAEEQRIDKAISAYDRWHADPRHVTRPDAATLRLAYRYQDRIRTSYTRATKLQTQQTDQTKSGIQNLVNQRFAAPAA